MPNHEYARKNEHYCYQEPRITAIETRLSNKKENLHEVHEDYYHLRDKLEAISENVVKLTTLMENSQDKEKENDEKIDELQNELAKANMEIGKLTASINTLQYLLGLGVPFACAIITFIIDYIL